MSVSKSIFNSQSSAALVASEGYEALMSITGQAVTYPLIVFEAGGSVKAHVQVAQDLEGNFYYTLFGQRLSSYLLECASPNRISSKDKILTVTGVGKVLLNRIKAGTLPEIKIAYNDLILTGYVIEVSFQTKYDDNKFRITVIGRYIGT